jgi:hypothetical protein
MIFNRDARFVRAIPAHDPFCEFHRQIAAWNPVSHENLIHVITADNFGRDSS